jgi:pyruvate dehydrogenase E2 component (dihydrolipoamide acetyltransferase)
MTTGSAVSVEVPDIGDFEDVPVIEILVSAGDHVAADDPLVTLESDKATMDVPAPFAGVIDEVRVSIGDRVSQGSPLVTISPESNGGAPADGGELAVGGGSAVAAAAASEGAPDEAAAPDSVASAAEAELGADGGSPAEAAPGQSSAPEAAPSAPPSRGGSSAAPNAGPIYASPSVRRLARELSVDLSAVSGSGRKGRIIREDVERAAQGGSPTPAPGGPTAQVAPAGSLAGLDLAPWPSLNFEKFGPVERVPRSRIQQISAPNLARNWVMIPHVTQHDEADITDLEAWRRELNEEHAKDGAKVTMVSFLVLASVAALKAYPDFNSSLDRNELIRKRYYNIGFAADTPGGLVVPVIKEADKKGLLDIARELTELSGKAREGKLSPGDISGSTFTISSLGGIGGTAFTPIINAPEVAILGVSRSATKPVWNGSEFTPRLMLPLSLSYDHRVIDGAAAARFVVHLGKLLSDLRRTLL